MGEFFKGWRRKVGLVTLVMACGITMIIGACGLLGMILEEPGMFYCVTAEFRELPDSDDELKQWLCDQPGVVDSYWSSPGISRVGNRVTAEWHHSKTWPRDKVTPNLQEQFDKFGYQGRSKYQETKRKETKDWS